MKSVDALSESLRPVFAEHYPGRTVTIEIDTDRDGYLIKVDGMVGQVSNETIEGIAGDDSADAMFDAIDDIIEKGRAA